MNTQQLLIETYVDMYLDEIELLNEVEWMQTPRERIIKHFKGELERTKQALKKPSILDDSVTRRKYQRYLEQLKRWIGIEKSRPWSFFQDTTPLFQGLSMVFVISLLSYGAYVIYKRFLSKHARMCKDKKGKVKSTCMIQLQVKALQASKGSLVKGRLGCRKAKNSQSCKAKMNKKINKMDKRIKKKRDKIKKLAGK